MLRGRSATSARGWACAARDLVRRHACAAGGRAPRGDAAVRDIAGAWCGGSGAQAGDGRRLRSSPAAAHRRETLTERASCGMSLVTDPVIHELQVRGALCVLLP